MSCLTRARREESLSISALMIHELGVHARGDFDSQLDSQAGRPRLPSLDCGGHRPVRFRVRWTSLDLRGRLPPS